MAVLTDHFYIGLGLPRPIGLTNINIKHRTQNIKTNET